MPDVPIRIEICRFPGNLSGAVTTSWDDGVIEDRPLVKLFNELGIKGTFNLNSSRFDRQGHIASSEVASLYKGHEVAIHTATHPHLPLLDPSQIAMEVLDDRRALEDLVGYPVRGMAYPFGTYSPRVIEVLRSLGIVYCRTTENRTPNFPPPEPLAWASTMHMFHTEPSPLPVRFAKWYEYHRHRDVFFVWGHSYEFARPTDRWAEMEKLFRPLAGHADLWYCTNIELFDYEAARQRMVIAANRKIAYNPSARTVTLSVDGRVIDVPGGQTVSLLG